MEKDNEIEAQLEKRFEAWFSNVLRDLRGTEIEIMAVKTSAHQWYFGGASEMGRIFTQKMIDQNRRWMEELDLVKR